MDSPVVKIALLLKINDLIMKGVEGSSKVIEVDFLDNRDRRQGWRQLFIDIIKVLIFFGIKVCEHSLRLTRSNNTKFIQLRSKIGSSGDSRRLKGPKEGPLHLLLSEV